MDHIILPSGHGTHLNIPYLGQENIQLSYDFLGFEEFPQRKGFNLITLRRNQGATDPTEQASIFQSWCFFGLLVEFFKTFDITFTIDDFLDYREENTIYLSTKNLPSLSRRLEATTYALSTDERAKIYCRVKPLLVTAGHAVRRLAKDTASPTWQIVHFSALTLGEYLENWVKFFLQSSDPTPNPWFGRSALTPQLMDEAGWCPSLTAALLDQEVDQSSIYYLSRIGQGYNSKDHATCSMNHCAFDKLNEGTYRTKHADDCPGSEECSETVLDSSMWILLTDIVEAGQVPLLTILAQNHNGKPNIKVTTSEKCPSRSDLDSVRKGSPRIDRTALSGVKPYVCISHVWSEYVPYSYCVTRFSTLKFDIRNSSD